MSVETLAPYFRARIEQAASGCWIWTGASTDGYGQLRYKGRRARAHRVVYELLCGPIPHGLVIDHLCRVRKCVNPVHLEPVTNAVNLLRGVGFAATNAAKTHCIKGHEFTAANTYVERSGRRHCRHCKRIAHASLRRRQRDARRAAKGLK